MASIVDQVKDQLNCSICLDTFTNPKLLQCNHAYCQKCLVRLVARDQQRRLVLICPECRHVTPVPAKGVDSLPPAFRVNKLLEIVKEPVGTRGKTESVTSQAVVCSEHDGKEVELYCKACEKTVCFKCIMKDGKHHSHDCEELSKAFEQYELEFKPYLDPLENQLVAVEKALQQFDVRRDGISKQQAAIETEIHNTVARLHETLDARKTELIGQLHRLTQSKLKVLAEQRNQIEKTQKRLSSCLSFIRKSLKTGNQEEALAKRSITAKQVKELTATSQPDMLEPNTESNMIFSAAGFAAECQKFGKVFAASFVKSYHSAKASAAVGERSTTIIQTLNYHNQPCKMSTSSITCELEPKMEDIRVQGSVERLGQNQYVISYQPAIKGRHQLHIMVKSQHIKGSPRPVAVMSSVEKLGVPLRALREVNEPIDVAVNQSGEVVVIEKSKTGQCVTLFSPRGKRLRSFGEFSPDSMHGIAVDGEGNIFLTDQVHHRVLKFSTHGDLLKEVDIEGNAQVYPRGITFSASNDKLYVTVGEDHVQILHSDLRPAGRFGRGGAGEGEFGDPRHVACDSAGNVYVADHWNHRVQVFTAEGKFLRKFGKHGDGKGEMKWPYGIAVDSNRNTYVGDYDSGRVSVFTPSGSFVTSLDIAERYSLQGLVVDKCGVLYVCDKQGKSIRRF